MSGFVKFLSYTKVSSIKANVEGLSQATNDRAQLFVAWTFMAVNYCNEI